MACGRRTLADGTLDNSIIGPARSRPRCAPIRAKTRIEVPKSPANPARGKSCALYALDALANYPSPGVKLT
jgi:hypothetical protein